MENEAIGGINNHRNHVLGFLRSYFHNHTITLQNSVNLDEDVKELLVSLGNQLSHGEDMVELYKKHDELNKLLEERVASIYNSMDGKVPEISMNGMFSKMVAFRMVELIMKITSYLFNELYFYNHMSKYIRLCEKDELPDDRFIKATKPKILQLFEMKVKMLEIAKRVYQKAQFDEWTNMTEHSILAMKRLAREFDKRDVFVGIEMVRFDFKNDFPMIEQIDAKLSEVGNYYSDEDINRIEMLTKCYKYDVKALEFFLRHPEELKDILDQAE